MDRQTLKLISVPFRCVLRDLVWFPQPQPGLLTGNMESAQSPRPEQSSKPSHEPIRFGIDRILGSSERQQGSESSTDSGTTTTTTFTALVAPLSAFPGSLEDPSEFVPNRTLGHRGVIRVPAHRPLGAAIAPPVVSAAPGFGPLCFPWVDNHRRFTKDRLPGKGKLAARAPWNSASVFKVHRCVCVCVCRSSLFSANVFCFINIQEWNRI